MKVILLHVVEPEPPVPDQPPRVRGMETRHVDAEEYLAPIAVDLRNRGVRVEVRVRQGRPVMEILATARETGADLIVMATHGRRGLRQFVFGSVAELVVHRAGVPVLLLKPGEAESGLISTAAPSMSAATRPAGAQ